MMSEQYDEEDASEEQPMELKEAKAWLVVQG